MVDTIDVQLIMREIRERIRKESDLPDFGLDRKSSGSAQIDDLTASLRSAQNLVGMLPPQPPTLRGWIGALFAKTVRRALLWYTPQLQSFHASVVRGFEQQAVALNALAIADRENREEIERLRTQVERLQSGLERANRLLKADAVAHDSMLAVNSRAARASDGG